MAKKKETILQLTPKGLFTALLNFDEALTRDFIDGLELFMRRNYNKPGEFGAIIFDGKEFLFTTVQYKEGKK